MVSPRRGGAEPFTSPLLRLTGWVDAVPGLKPLTTQTALLRSGRSAELRDCVACHRKCMSPKMQPCKPRSYGATGAPSRCRKPMIQAGGWQSCRTNAARRELNTSGGSERSRRVTGEPKWRAGRAPVGSRVSIAWGFNPRSEAPFPLMPPRRGGVARQTSALPALMCLLDVVQGLKPLATKTTLLRSGRGAELGDCVACPRKCSPGIDARRRRRAISLRPRSDGARWRIGAQGAVIGKWMPSRFDLALLTWRIFWYSWSVSLASFV